MPDSVVVSFADARRDRLPFARTRTGHVLHLVAGGLGYSAVCGVWISGGRRLPVGAAGDMCRTCRKVRRIREAR